MKKSFLIYAPLVLFMATSLPASEAKASWLDYTDLVDHQKGGEEESQPEKKVKPHKKDGKKKDKVKAPHQEKAKTKPHKKEVKVVTASPPKGEVKPEAKKQKLTYFHSNPTMIYEMAEDEQRGSHATGVLWTKEGDTWWKYSPNGKKEKSTPPKTMY